MNPLQNHIGGDLKAPSATQVSVNSYEVIPRKENTLKLQMSDGTAVLAIYRNHGRSPASVVDITNEKDDWIHDDIIWASVSRWFYDSFAVNSVEGISNPRGEKLELDLDLDLLGVGRDTLRSFDAQEIFDMIDSDPESLVLIQKLQSSQYSLSSQGQRTLANLIGEPISDYDQLPDGFQTNLTEEELGAIAEQFTMGWYPPADYFTSFMEAISPQLEILSKLSAGLYDRLEEVSHWYLNLRLPEENLVREFTAKLGSLDLLDSMSEGEQIKYLLSGSCEAVKIVFSNRQEYIDVRYGIFLEAADFEKRIADAIAPCGDLAKELLPQFWDNQLNEFYSNMLPRLLKVLEKQAERIWL